MAAFPGGLPTARALDEVVADRPVALANRDHHGMWVNSRALQAAGITEGTPDPVDGRIERDADGRPTGVLHEGAMDLLAGVLPEADDDQMYAGFLEGQRYLHSLGITGWQDAIVGSYSGMRDAGPTYARAAASGDLTGTVVGALWWDRERGSEQIAELLARREAYTRGQVRRLGGQDHAGRCRRERDGRPRRALPGSLRTRDGQLGHLLRRPRVPAQLRPRARRPRLPGARPRAGGSRRPRGPGRVRGHPSGSPAPHRTPPARAPRRRRPVRGSSASRRTSRRSGPATTTR